jgi:hypothetical protein
MLDCGSQAVRISSVLGWSEIAVNHAEGGKGGKSYTTSSHTAMSIYIAAQFSVKSHMTIPLSFCVSLSAIGHIVNGTVLDYENLYEYEICLLALPPLPPRE